MTDHPRSDDDAPLSPRERAALAAWDAPAVTPGLADRVLARAAGAPVVVEQARPRRRAWPLAVSAVAALAVAAGGVALVQRRAVAPAAAVHGAAAMQARQQVALGPRGVAVGEAGAVLRWDIGPGAAAAVSQTQGDVFYRVEPGGPFEVTTPVGEVRVTGTCFRVDIGAEEPMKNRYAAAIGGAVGALATVAVVTVYEGQVVVANSRGEVTASAGERVALRAGAAPVVRGAEAVGQAPSPPEVDLPAGAGTAVAVAPALAALSPAELLATAEAQRVRLADLEAEVRRLQAAGPGADADDPAHPWFDPGPETLKAWAAECRVRIDMPPMMRPDAMSIDPRNGAALGLAEPERAAINAALADAHRTFGALVRALYLETTGDTTGGDTLSVEAMMREVEDKNGADEADAVRARIARERAGLAAPPTAAALAAAPPVERLLRAMAAIGGDLERVFAGIIGPARARALRASRQGPFGSHMEMAGCADGGDAAAAD